MIPEQKGQSLILAAVLILILILAYCAIPGKSTDTQRKAGTQVRSVLRPYLADLLIRKSENALPAESKTIVQETGQQEKAEAVPAAKDPEPEPEPAPKTAAPPDPKPVPVPEDKAASDGIILMDSPGYASHTKPIVRFTHQKHMDEYSKSCGDCHHDNMGKPLDLKPGGPVSRCIQCHKETKKKKGEKLEKPEKIKIYHDEALHANCIECHKAYNIEKGDPKGMGPAPVPCKACHQQ
ncbi:MAG: hypothetical protein A2277_03030 [Desulfobacterales bacterium RIFOXYA12_FULL_46_15]|nr:MAG: hypothetical protein A2277_03030 [Desulfobacterales bacterium RIFOXYA12_FULL_46_15]